MCHERPTDPGDSQVQETPSRDHAFRGSQSGGTRNQRHPRSGGHHRGVLTVRIPRACTTGADRDSPAHQRHSYLLRGGLCAPQSHDRFRGVHGG